MDSLEPAEKKRLAGLGAGSRVHTRLAIAVLLHEETPGGMIAWFLQCHQSTVWRWQRRAAEAASPFDAPRSGRPVIYGEEQQLRTIAFYCHHKGAHSEQSEGSIRTLTHRWSFRWAHRWITNSPEEGVLPMSRGTLHRIVRSHQLQPHRNRYFLQITDPDFFSKAEHLIDLYANPPEFLFNYDECPGIQVTVPVAPDLEAVPERPRLREFEYRRHGTIDVLAFLRPKTGEVFARCTDNHTSETFLDVFTAHVQSQPGKASLHYIMDNLNTHFNDAFCHRVAELSEVTYSPLESGKERRQWLQGTDKRIVVNFTPFHGSWLNLIEVWFSILSQRCLKHCCVEVEKKKAAIEGFFALWNEHFAHPFKWSYTGEGLKEKVLSRFSSFVLSDSGQLEASFLAKQFNLIANLAESTPQIRQTSQWQALEKQLESRREFLEQVIAQAPKECQQQRAMSAWQRFNDVVQSGD